MIIALASLFMETSVPTEMPAVSIYGLPHTSEVYNLGKLQAQLLVFVTGVAVAIAGIMVALSGVVLDAVARSCRSQYPAEPTQSDITNSAMDSLPERAPAETMAFTPLANEDAQYRGLLIVGIAMALLLVVLFAFESMNHSPSASTDAQLNMVAVEQNADTIADSIERNAGLVDDMASPTQAGGNF